MGGLPARCGHGSTELPRVPETCGPGHLDGWHGVVRDASLFEYVDSRNTLCRAAFEIVALAAGRLGALSLAAQSIIMTADQSTSSQSGHRVRTSRLIMLSFSSEHHTVWHRLVLV